MRSEVTAVLFIILIGKAKGDAEACSVVEGKTWSTKGQLQLKPGTESSNECASHCIQRVGCTGYTWIKSFSGIQNTCILFRTLEDEYPCNDCTSGYVSQQCLCSFTGLCQPSEGTLVASGFEQTEYDCSEACRNNNSCKYYSWTDSTAVIKNECMMFSDCKGFTLLNSGIRTGPKNCSMDGDMCGFIPVHYLTDTTRDINHGSGDYCDKGSGSPDWMGPGWYRINGSRLTNKDYGLQHCNTVFSGFLKGEHSSTIGQLATAEICFQTGSFASCSYPAEIQMINCGEYYMYNLTEIYRPFNECPARYCTEKL